VSASAGAVHGTFVGSDQHREQVAAAGLRVELGGEHAARNEAALEARPRQSLVREVDEEPARIMLRLLCACCVKAETITIRNPGDLLVAEGIDLPAPDPPVAWREH